jgi:hypothetical protein
MIDAEREILFLPERRQYIVQTTEFQEMKKKLAKVSKVADEEDKERPSLIAPEQDCPPPDKIEWPAH